MRSQKCVIRPDGTINSTAYNIIETDNNSKTTMDEINSTQGNCDFRIQGKLIFLIFFSYDNKKYRK
jgi:hypothetical protein